MATLTERIVVAQDQINAATIEYQEWVKRVAAGYKGKAYDYQNTAWHKALSALGTRAEYNELFNAAKDMGPDPDPVPEPIPIPSTFGSDLKLRLAKSPGSMIDVSSLSALRQQIISAPLGSIIRVTAPIDMGGQDLVINRQASAAQPITLTGTAPIRNGRILVSRAGYIRAQLSSEDSPINGYKITDGSHHIDIDLEGRKIIRSGYSGILQTDPACHDWQVWNARVLDCGTVTNQDHGLYLAAANGVCVVANCLVENSQAYGMQIYPNSQGVLVTGCTIRGGRTRGGFVLGTEHEVTKDITIVGCVVTGSKVGALETWTWGYVIQNGWAYDCIEYNNVSGFKANVMQYENCIHADPTTAAKGHVKPARYGLLPPTDIDGKPRVTADAGCFAL